MSAQDFFSDPLGLVRQFQPFPIAEILRCQVPSTALEASSSETARQEPNILTAALSPLADAPSGGLAAFRDLLGL